MMLTCQRTHLFSSWHIWGVLLQLITEVQVTPGQLLLVWLGRRR